MNSKPVPLKGRVIYGTMKNAYGERVENPEEIEIIKLILNYNENGHEGKFMSAKLIVHLLNKQKITMRGNEWTVNAS